MIRYPLATPSWGAEELLAIKEVVASEQFTMGPRVRAFEEAFANFVGSRYAVMVNSGSSANLLMIAILCTRKNSPLKPGDEVIVPAVSWSTTYCPLQQYGLRLKFVDIDAETLNFDLEALSAAVGPQTKAILAVNLLGNSNDFTAIERIIAGRPIIMLEDNCESLGATFGGHQAGTFGLMGSYSTFFSHHMSTMEGGLVTTDDEECFHLALSMRAHGWTRQLPSPNTICTRSNDPFMESFRFVTPGFNFRPLEMSGAIGLHQLRKLPSFIAIRQENAQHFTARFAGHRHFTIQREIGKSSWFGFAMTLRDESPLTRDQVVQYLADGGIECRPVVAGNYTRHQAIEYFNYSIHDKLRNADRVHDRGLFVGNNQVPIHDQIDHMAKVLADL
jgi:CDP-4-dehydro-6-deoxyglucose reductase, E1